MATYYVDDGGDNTTGASWATAYTSLAALDDAIGLATAGDIIYIGHDSVDSYTYAANKTFNGPSNGAPVKIISATTGSAPPTYQKSSTNQIDTSAGAYYVRFDGSFALYGLKIKSGNRVYFAHYHYYESLYLIDVTVAPAADCLIDLIEKCFTKNLTIDLTADGTTNRTGSVFDLHDSEILGLSFVNAGYRTGTIFPNSYGLSGCNISGADFSGFINASGFYDATGGDVHRFANCKMPATWTPFAALPNMYYTYDRDILFTNCSSGNDTSMLIHGGAVHNLLSTDSIYRTGGAEIDSTNISWLVTTNSYCREANPGFTPWIYGEIDSTGSKTFDVYITNDLADFNDSECWLEVEYLGTSGEGKWSLASDTRADITTTAAAQTDDTTSVWNGTGPSFTYKQKLSVTATINTIGQYRARVVVAKELASSAYFYIDPLVTVS